MKDVTACARCGGLLRIERVRRTRLQLLACLSCGDRVDETILANRRCMARTETHSWKTRIWDRIQLLASGKWQVAGGTP